MGVTMSQPVEACTISTGSPYGAYIHIGVGSNVVCSSGLGNARASGCGTDNKQFPRFFYARICKTRTALRLGTRLALKRERDTTCLVLLSNGLYALALCCQRCLPVITVITLSQKPQYLKFSKNIFLFIRHNHRMKKGIVPISTFRMVCCLPTKRRESPIA